MSARAAIRAAVLALAPLPLAAPAHGQALRDALAAAYRTSPDLVAERARLRETDERVPQALANTRPVLQAFGSGGLSHQNTNLPVNSVSNVAVGSEGGTLTVPINLSRLTYGVSISEPLFRGGRTRAELREARDLVAAGRWRLLSVEARVLLDAATDYAELARAQSQMALVGDREATLAAQLRQATGRFAAGALVRTDLLATDAAHDEAVAAVATARAQLAAARSAFARDIGTAPPARATLEEVPPPPPPSLADAQELAIARNPQILSAQKLVEASRQRVRDVFGEGLPNVALQGVAQHEDGVDFRGEHADSQALLVSVRVPIYTGGVLSSRVRAARDEVEVQAATLDRLHAEIRAFVESSWEAYAAAREAVRLYAREAATDRLALTGVRAQAAGGERTQQDVLAAQDLVVVAEAHRLAAERDALVAAYTLLAATGGLSATRLALDVPRYDPEIAYRRVHYGPGR
ncbi:TolC family protein [Sphingomonas morindae]|uniref:TolC family protein n=1 Tax=Sphingomonas morindae TaxID=1541170 RepID=A0ABY4X822_9SPHN|nr:TolC family protein [Sphingomonas morindae]USI72800.1 TolC family protein [Sphingomonas morindae]